MLGLSLMACIMTFLFMAAVGAMVYHFNLLRFFRKAPRTTTQIDSSNDEDDEDEAYDMLVERSTPKPQPIIEEMARPHLQQIHRARGLPHSEIGHRFNEVRDQPRHSSYAGIVNHPSLPPFQYPTIHSSSPFIPTRPPPFPEYYYRMPQRQEYSLPYSPPLFHEVAPRRNPFLMQVEAMRFTTGIRPPSRPLPKIPWSVHPDFPQPPYKNLRALPITKPVRTPPPPPPTFAEVLSKFYNDKVNMVKNAIKFSEKVLHILLINLGWLLSTIPDWTPSNAQQYLISVRARQRPAPPIPRKKSVPVYYHGPLHPTPLKGLPVCRTVIPPRPPPTVKSFFIESSLDIAIAFLGFVCWALDQMPDLSPPALEAALAKAVLTPEIEAALDPQAAVEQKIDALFELQQKLEAPAHPIEHQTMMSYAQTLVKQVPQAPKDVTYERQDANEPQSAPQSSPVLRFWIETLSDFGISDDQDAVPSSTIVPTTQSQPDTATNSKPTVSPAESSDCQEDLDEAARGQAAFIAAMSKTRVEGLCSGGDALRYPASRSRSGEQRKRRRITMYSRPPRKMPGALETSDDERESNSGDVSLKACSDRNAACPSSTFLSTSTFSSSGYSGVREIAEKGTESRAGATGDEDVEMGSEDFEQSGTKKRKLEEREPAEIDSQSEIGDTGRSQGKRQRVGTNKGPNDDVRPRSSRRRDRKQLRFRRSPSLCEVRVFQRHSAPSEYIDEWVGRSIESPTRSPSPSPPPPETAQHRVISHYEYDRQMRWRTERQREEQRSRMCDYARRIYGDTTRWMDPEQA